MNHEENITKLIKFDLKFQCEGQVDDFLDFDVVMSMYDLMENNDNYSKASEILWQYCSDEPALAADGTRVTDFNEDNVTSMFNLKEKRAGLSSNNGTKNVEIMVSLKYLSNVWRTREMFLTNYKNNLNPKYAKNCVIVATNAAAQVTTFSITNTILYVPVVTLSTQDNIKLLQ